ncbi:MAG: hypothetical protein WAN66_10185 [Limnoraphis robusta]|jgi:hypothetical protein|nr:hypothetical protein [Limnoraphis robusta]MCG5056740.1 hypothetical protein [Limnoraphis sp. WC205]MEA5497054.1 hypothetical protein [Limnoraphis robusta BA-68 BA1]MEA5519443.1 hypothetical protein [Limnoraphis robusta CCNP1315]MEA5537413.1 hypothetical protein [Limnoraphis robusta Tam1]MEA5544225.1 hypothetical protein [Limnoraphis robusta CCNP1324]
MNSQAMSALNPLTIGKVIDRIIATGRLTRSDQKLLHTLSRIQPSISHEENHKIQRLRDRLQMGLLKLI